MIIRENCIRRWNPDTCLFERWTELFISGVKTKDIRDWAAKINAQNDIEAAGSIVFIRYRKPNLKTLFLLQWA